MRAFMVAGGGTRPQFPSLGMVKNEGWNADTAAIITLIRPETLTEASTQFLAA